MQPGEWRWTPAGLSGSEFANDGRRAAGATRISRARILERFKSHIAHVDQEILRAYRGELHYFQAMARMAQTVRLWTLANRVLTMKEWDVDIRSGRCRSNFGLLAGSFRIQPTLVEAAPHLRQGDTSLISGVRGSISPNAWDCCPRFRARVTKSRN